MWAVLSAAKLLLPVQIQVRETSLSNIWVRSAHATLVFREMTLTRDVVVIDRGHWLSALGESSASTLVQWSFRPASLGEGVLFSTFSYSSLEGVGDRWGDALVFCPECVSFLFVESAIVWEARRGTELRTKCRVFSFFKTPSHLPFLSSLLECRPLQEWSKDNWQIWDTYSTLPNYAWYHVDCKRWEIAYVYSLMF